MGTIQCPSCGKRILEKDIFCPHCGTEIKNHKSPLDQSINKKDVSVNSVIVGMIGSTMMIMGAFMPAINMPLGKSMSYIANGKGDGMFLLVVAAFALYFVFKERKFGIILASMLSLFMIGLDLSNTMTKINHLEEKITTGMEHLIMGNVGIGFGFGVMIVGAILLLVSGIMTNSKK